MEGTKPRCWGLHTKPLYLIVLLKASTVLCIVDTALLCTYSYLSSYIVTDEFFNCKILIILIIIDLPTKDVC